ncbi:transglutaminase-like domain-containing protein, partial [Endozoicomonas sp. SESOKO2]|uniref:transglutaminase-like domain-containing protein n=1 Tax=Endozoicomonas sp. SESOKO2 TaxID=2828743 RepID=UPI0021496B17
RSTWFDAVCSEGMKTVLDKVFKTIEEHPTKVRGLLQSIKDAKDTEQQIKAITDYCRAFSGDAKPKLGENFFQFLVTRLKGSCRHRVPVFIAMCRYFGIPSRQIDSSSHSFAEYSGDGGHTWESVDLGGAPVREKEITPKFQPTRKVSASSTETRMIKNHLKGADLGQQQALAEASGINLRKLDKALEAGSVLPTINPGTYETVLKLWKRKDLTGFLMGVSMIESLETKALIHELSDLAGDIGIGNKPMSEAVKKILSSNDENQVTQPLKVLHSKMIFHGDASSEDWLNSMVYILAWSDLAKSSVIQFALEALKSGWLDPVPVRSFETEGKVEHHKLLLRLEDVDELKVEAARCLKMWYTTYLSREKNSQRWLYTYKGFQERADYALFITHCHDGFSSRLEYNMVDSSMQTAWTYEPEGIPNIERMLLRQPAFSQLIPGKANHRPVIILGQPSWHITTIDEKAEALYQRLLEHSSDLNKQSLEKIKRYDAVVNQRENALKALAREYSDVATSGWKNKTRKDQYEEERFDIQKRYRDICKSSKLSYDELHFSDDLRKKCKQAIKQAFSHYMYKVTHSKGGCLTYCWAGAKVGPKDNIGKYCGAHDPSSPEELYAMMSAVVSSFNFINNSKDNYLRQALNASNALVLKLDELTNIAEEFVSSVDLDSIYESLV